MKSYPIFLFLLFISCSHPQKNLYDILDNEIAEAEKYEGIKNHRIDSIKELLIHAQNPEQRFKLTDSLIKEFESYNADSALYYISQNIPNTNNPEEEIRLRIKRADIFGHAGLFSDALNVMTSISSHNLSDSLREEYYSIYSSIYQYLCEYTSDHEPVKQYETYRSLYADSLRQITNENSFNHIVYVLTQQARDGEQDKAIKILTERMENYRPGTREYSIIASILADLHKNNGSKEEYKRYQTLSAISDVQGAIKENVSFRSMAITMFEDGDVERANRYLKKSIADANFYSAIMRNAQSAKMLPIIDEAYSKQQQSMHRNLRGLVIATAILAFILIITLVFVLLQFRRLRKEHSRVNHLNEELQSLTRELEAANNELRKSNLIKEQYASLFMEYCSTSIATIEKYQKSLRSLSLQTTSRQALIKKIETTQIADELRKNFYLKFDEAILNIYPSFIEKFNSLLIPGQEVILKPGELLNTELRLYALIRIGIEDSNHIAQFLQCSLSTVYTYRSKIKKRSLDPSSFETQIRRIE